MESLEMTVFLLIGVIVVALVVSFAVGVDYGAIQESMVAGFTGQDAPGTLREVPFARLPKEAASCWSACAFGRFPQECATVNVSDEGTLSSGALLGAAERTLVCRECTFVVEEERPLPGIVRIACTPDGIRFS